MWPGRRRRSLKWCRRAARRASTFGTVPRNGANCACLRPLRAGMIKLSGPPRRPASESLGRPTARSVRSDAQRWNGRRIGSDEVDLAGPSARMVSRSMQGSGGRPGEDGFAGQPSTALGPGSVPLTLHVNGASAAWAEPRVTLLDALRERLGLTGTKKGCDQASAAPARCWWTGGAINACLTLAVMHAGQRDHHDRGPGRRATRCIPVQAAFIEHDGFQCGYCTPGQIMSARGAARGGPRRAPTTRSASG